MSPDAELLAALTRVEDTQAALARTLRPVSLARLHERPPSGAWSPMENVRHLVFAEQHHFAVLLPRGFRWSSAGVPPPNRTGERRLNSVGRDPSATVDDVFDAWAKVHAVVRARCIETPTAGVVRGLAGNLNHITVHAATIEQLLSG